MRRPRDAATAIRPRTGQVALVTGGSAGLGLAIAPARGRVGVDVLLTGRSAERCHHVAARLSAETGSSVQGSGCDVADESAVAGLVDRVLADHGRLDVQIGRAS